MTMNERVEHLKMAHRSLLDSYQNDRRPDWTWLEVIMMTIEDMEEAASRSKEKAFKANVARKATA